MIVYQETNSVFITDVRNDEIAEKIERFCLEKLGPKTSKSEFYSWRNSMSFMHDAMDDTDIPADSGISIELQPRGASTRIDFIIAGIDENADSNIVIVEVKQWSSIETTQMDAEVFTYLGKGLKQRNHPSYQVWSYAKYLESFSVHVYENEVNVTPCAFLHNYSITDNAILDPFYEFYTQKAPVFRKTEASKLGDFIKRFIKTGDNGKVIYEIDNGGVRPSKALAEALPNLIKGKKEYLLIDQQKVVFEATEQTVLQKHEKPNAPKDVLIINGGPGTGKSVVAINLLVDIIGKRLNAHYVTKNSAPREVYAAKLTGTITKTLYHNLFKSSGSYIGCEPDSFDLLVVDEAHRLNEKTGMFKKGVNQVAELISAARTTVFFVDPHQRVAFSDIGSIAEIEKHAKAHNACVQHFDLPSQFRCGGSDGYLGWVDNILGVRETANTTFDQDAYDFRVFDDPSQMYDEILRLNDAGESSRLLAGYCWPWASRKNPMHYDIEFPEHDFQMRWNDFNLGQGWIMHPESIEQVGCIHTSQGLEVKYAGVIIGKDLKFVDGELVTDPLQHPGQDKNFSGLRTRLKGNKQAKDAVLAESDELIRNTYRTLMTRGMKGTFVYCEDDELREHMKRIVANK